MFWWCIKATYFEYYSLWVKQFLFIYLSFRFFLCCLPVFYFSGTQTENGSPHSLKPLFIFVNISTRNPNTKPVKETLCKHFYSNCYTIEKYGRNGQTTKRNYHKWSEFSNKWNAKIRKTVWINLQFFFSSKSNTFSVIL